MLTYERANELLSYDSSSGVLTWKITVGQRALKGSIASTLDKKGYIYLGIDGKYYFGHRLAWLLHHGKWPHLQLDHRNEVKDDNRIDNLREVTGIVNVHNQWKPRRHNTTGYRGVSKKRDEVPS